MKRQPEPGPAVPEPLAVIPSGLPLAEVVARLNELRAQPTDAEVRRGRGSDWELWAPQPLADSLHAPAVEA